MTVVRLLIPLGLCLYLGFIVYLSTRDRRDERHRQREASRQLLYANAIGRRWRKLGTRRELR